MWRKTLHCSEYYSMNTQWIHWMKKIKRNLFFPNSKYLKGTGKYNIIKREQRTKAMICCVHSIIIYAWITKTLLVFNIMFMPVYWCVLTTDCCKHSRNWLRRLSSGFLIFWGERGVVYALETFHELFGNKNIYLIFVSLVKFWFFIIFVEEVEKSSKHLPIYHKGKGMKLKVFAGCYSLVMQEIYYINAK